MSTWNEDTRTLDATDEELMDALRWAVAERGPDYRYPAEWRDQPTPDGEAGPSCLYRAPDGSGPGCLIGLAWDHLGVPADWIANREGAGAWTLLPLLVPRIPDAPPLAVRPGARIRHAYTRAQEVQDGGGAWGTALAEAEHAYAGRPEVRG